MLLGTIYWCVLFFFFLPHSMWDLNSSNRDQTLPPVLESWSLNHWTTREGLWPFIERRRGIYIYIYMKVLVDQSCPTLFDPMDYSLPGSSVHGILQARRILEWVAIPFSRGSSQIRDRTRVFCTAGRFFTIRATREATYTYTHTFVPAQISSGKIYKKLEIVVASRKKARVEWRLIFLYIPFGTNCMIMYLQYRLRKPS